MTKKNALLALFGILVLGAALRFVGIGALSFSADEFLDINSSYGYFRTGEWKAWDFNNGQTAIVNENVARDERANVYKWQVSQLFRFLPPTEGVARTVSALWGIVSVALLYLVGWKLSGRRTVGLFAAFLFAVSVSGIEFDRRLRMYAMFFPIFLAFSTSLFFLYEREYKGRFKAIRKIWERSGVNLSYLIPTLTFGILSAKTHQLTVNIVPIFGVYVLSMAVIMMRSGTGIRNRYSVTALIGFVGVLGLWVIAPEKVRLLSGTLVFFEDHYSYFGYVVRDYVQPILALFLAGLGAWSLFRTFDRKREAVWLVASFLTPFLMAVFLWRRNEGEQYIFFAQSFLLILVAAGGYALVREVKGTLSGKWKRSACIATIVLAVLVPDWGYFFRDNNAYRQTSSGTNANYRKVFTYVRKHADKGDALVTRNFRNYYFSGMEARVLDYGGELSTEKLSVAELEAFMRTNPTGWFVASDNDMDYVSRETESYIIRTMERQSDPLLRGSVLVYRWNYTSE
ncbi:MAG: hypothetical protein HGB34_02910 [Candidatus Moranbacteria bacterium]|nr:hypothetical protein [Candidatus Moranbacteria bacterium]